MQFDDVDIGRRVVFIDGGTDELDGLLRRCVLPRRITGLMCPDDTLVLRIDATEVLDALDLPLVIPEFEDIRLPESLPVTPPRVRTPPRELLRRGLPATRRVIQPRRSPSAHARHV